MQTYSQAQPFARPPRTRCCRARRPFAAHEGEPNTMFRSLSLLVLLPFAACVGNTYSIPTPAYDAAKYEVVGDASTTKTGIMLLQLIPIGQNDKIERAMQLLMQEKGGDALTDVTIRESWFWAYVLNGYSVKVEAKVLKKKG
jgi:hypothetical protein